MYVVALLFFSGCSWTSHIESLLTNSPSVVEPQQKNLLEGQTIAIPFLFTSPPKKNLTVTVFFSSDSGVKNVDWIAEDQVFQIAAGQSAVDIVVTMPTRIGYQGSREFFINLQIGSEVYAYRYKIIESEAPPAVDTLSVYSAFTANSHTSTSSTPDYRVSFLSVPSNPLQMNFEIVRVSDSAVITSWTKTSNEVLSWVSQGSLTLQNGTSYFLRCKSVDTDSNQQSGWINSANFVIDVLTDTPYSGLGLPDVLTLPDQALSNTTVSGTTYTRINPFQAKDLSLSGMIDWTTNQSSALFFRADKVAFGANAVLNASGRDYFDDNWGTQGGSGGGAPTGCGGIAADGGSNGQNGLNATGGGCMGQPGLGFGQTYSVGFTYGTGGNGGIGNSAVGGTGGNASGGGGGGSFNLWGGGTGGGGLIVLLANDISGTASLRATGGNQLYNHPDRAGGGGGGVIWSAFKKYRGNIHPNVAGGKGNAAGNTSGTIGTARIFQIKPDNSLIERRFEDSWDETSFTPHPGIIPYPLSELEPVANLADETIAIPTTLDGFIYSRVNPYSKKDLTISAPVTPQSSKPTSIFIRARNLIIGAGGSISANADGKNGGSGASGAGGCGNTPSHQGGSAGADGDIGGGTCPAFGGLGWGKIYAQGFNYGNGGNGGANSDAWIGGLGGNGAGGGGTGSSDGLFGSGGGGGGLVVIMADSLSGTGSVQANGAAATGNRAGGGGGGVIWIAVKSYTGTITAQVNGGLSSGLGATDGLAGTARIFQWNPDNTLTERLFTDSW